MDKFEQLAKQRLDHNRQKLAIKETQEQRLSFAYEGGLFRADPQTLTYIETWCRWNQFQAADDKKQLPLVVKDLYDNPVLIKDPDDFCIKLVERHTEVMNDWYNEYTEIKNKRRVEDL